jgi:hypothetical protein
VRSGARHSSVPGSAARRAAAVACLAALLAGCLGIGQGSADASARRVAKHPARGPSIPPTTLIATLNGPAAGYASPFAASSFVSVPASFENVPSSLPVVSTSRGWFEVQLPPGLSPSPTAWLRSTSVWIAENAYRIVVDLSTTRLLLYRRGRAVLCAPAAVGSAASPTPLGRFFVTLLAQPPDPSYGSFVILTSAPATGVTDWQQQHRPVITIEGPRDSAQLIAAGDARVTTGAVRLADTDLVKLRPVPIGTLIDVVAPPVGQSPPGEAKCVAARDRAAGAVGIG